MAEDSGTSIGTWVTPRGTSEHPFTTEMLDEFDSYMEREYDDLYHRSKHMKRAMFVYLRIHQQFDQLESWDRPEDLHKLSRFISGAMKDAYEQDLERRDR